MAFEILAIIIVVTIILAGIVRIGGPLADAFANRLKLKFEELGPEQERALKVRLAALEQEMRDLRKQVISIQETTDFTVKLLETRKTE